MKLYIERHLHTTIGVPILFHAGLCGTACRPSKSTPGEVTVATIAIIGAGFSGTLLTLHLLRRCCPATRIHLIERNRQFGPGAAYSSGNPSPLLNVPAGKMSAFRDRPGDFVDWLRLQDDTRLGIGPI